MSNSYSYPADHNDQAINDKSNPDVGSLWYDQKADDMPYIITCIKGTKYAINLTDGTPYSHYSEGPFGIDPNDFEPLDETLLLTPDGCNECK